MNNDKYAKNLGICGSPLIYSVEYKCTNADTTVTTINITAVTLSYCNPKSTENSPVSIHVNNFTYTGSPPIPTSIKIFMANKLVIINPPVVIYPAPSSPIFLPHSKDIIAPINGINIITIYIFLFFSFLPAVCPLLLALSPLFSFFAFPPFAGLSFLCLFICGLLVLGLSLLLSLPPGR